MTMLTDYRCPHCKRLLFKARGLAGAIEIKCVCKAVATFNFPPPPVAYAVTDWHGMARQTSTQTPGEAHEKGLTLTVTK